MPTNTYVALDTKTIGTAVSSVTFTSIPSGYTDLVMVINGTTASDGSYRFQCNGDTATNYSSTLLYGNGTSAISLRGSNETSGAGGRSGTSNSTSIIQFMNYANTNTFKTVISRGNNPGAILTAQVSLWRNTSAITSILISSEGGNLQVGSTFTIYGIASTDKFALATGGYLYEDSTYWYHVFTSTGTFTPKQSLTADILVVAGGGGGGSGWGGGGGAGGLLSFTSQSLTATGYTCTVGAGGAAGTRGTSGTGSQFGALTASVAGGGGAGAGVGGAFSGGSGGGGTYDSTSGGAGTSGQGFAGGAGDSNVSGGNARGGGGGGAGAVGGAAVANTLAGAGGIGATSSFINSIGSITRIGQLSSGNYYLAGGGGGGGANGGTAQGGAAGIGGGGIGAGNVVAGSGTANTGGGGGGAGGAGGTSGSGGSGLVIVRYAK